ncbi:MULTISPECIES: hypothetical protein [unclassified Variovorax]|uniref:hypothetical protein n=1 Tax=unclassified Variovorax TaxID=663243 RepID=UPI002575B354|nr:MULTISPECIES: hypothetical protein [unclassified Variovorax]MDM0086864.1 hypothetical protein [Variovorax sp. J22G40]MDM0144880.1 hypothetical protein [Variovorax sp. J2P1-31]
MNRTQAMVRIEEMAKLGGALPLPQAIANLAAVIDHLDMYSDTYESDVAALVGVGAVLWRIDGDAGPARPAPRD